MEPDLGTFTALSCASGQDSPRHFSGNSLSLFLFYSKAKYFFKCSFRPTRAIKKSNWVLLEGQKTRRPRQWRIFSWCSEVLLLFTLGLLYAVLWVTSYTIHVSFCDKPLVEDRLGIDLLLLFFYRYILIWTHFNLLLVLSSYCSFHLGVMMVISLEGWRQWHLHYGDQNPESQSGLRHSCYIQVSSVLHVKMTDSVPSGNVLRTEKSPFQAFWVEWNSDHKRNWNPFY